MTTFYLEYGEQRHPLAGSEPVTVGSGASCTVKVQGEGVHEEHAILRVDGDQVVLQSRVPSEHDARVNGVAIHAAALQSGDTVRFGNVETTFEMGEGGAKLRLQDASRDLIRGVNAIGRDPSGGVVLDDESVSRKHAALFILPSGQVVVRDLGSANGTVVKDRRLGEMRLQAGDEIRLGEAVLRLGRQEAAPQPPAGIAGAAAAKTVVGARPAAVAPAAPPPAPKLELEFRGAKRPLKDGTVRIGRAPDCDVVIEGDALVSRYHAELSVSGGQALLRDLGSSNGTRVNGQAISQAHALQDGDRIGIGGEELSYSAEVPVTPYGQTMVARKLPQAAGQTVMAPMAGGAARPPVPKGAGIVPTDRESALLALDLASDAREEQIQRRYQELYSEFQIRLTNAPTRELKSTYERRLGELRSAAAILLPQAAAVGTSDLPAIEPVKVDPQAVAASAGAAGEAHAAPQGVSPAPAVATPIAAAAAAKKASGKQGIPRSTLFMAVVAAVLVGALVYAALGAARAGRQLAGLQSDLQAKQTELEGLEAELPKTEAALGKLSQTKSSMLKNAQLKICNRSSRALRWVWLNAAWFDERDASFRSFDTASDTQWEYLFGERIEPGASFSGEWVVGEERIWAGEAIFFAALFEYGGQDVLRAGATPALDGGCFPLNLDR